MISYHEDCYNPPKGLLMNARFATNKFVSEWFATKEFAIEWFATENIDIVLRKVYYWEDCYFREVCYKLPRKLSVLQKRLTCLEEFVIKKNAILFQEVRRISPRNIYVAEKKGYVSRRKHTKRIECPRWSWKNCWRKAIFIRCVRRRMTVVEKIEDKVKM